MLIGVPKEIKTDEFRVGLLPHIAHELIAAGHEVLVEKDAAQGIGITNEDYMAVGAKIVDDPADIFDQAEMIVKVKEPQLSECKKLREGQILFTYLHLAPDPKQAEALMQSGCTAIAYETVTDHEGRLPLLSPMSEVAGRLAVQQGAAQLVKHQGGSGILLGGVPGVAPARVIVIGGGVVGTNAIKMALGMEADVTVMDRSLDRLRELNMIFGGKLKTQYASTAALKSLVPSADLVIGAVLIPGGSAPKLIDRDMLTTMRAGSVLVDVSIDQGGCFVTSRPTTHSEPTFVESGIVHYCVANMPGAVPRTAAFALNNATMPFTMMLANAGLEACKRDVHLGNGLNVHQGKITHAAVAAGLGYDYVSVREVFA